MFHLVIIQFVFIVWSFNWNLETVSYVTRSHFMLMEPSCEYLNLRSCKLGHIYDNKVLIIINKIKPPSFIVAPERSTFWKKTQISQHWRINGNIWCVQKDGVENFQNSHEMVKSVLHFTGEIFCLLFYDLTWTMMCTNWIKPAYFVQSIAGNVAHIEIFLVIKTSKLVGFLKTKYESGVDNLLHLKVVIYYLSKNTKSNCFWTTFIFSILKVDWHLIL